eukprot:9031778-Lingulodinium_polyedra.AAC.1
MREIARPCRRSRKGKHARNSEAVSALARRRRLRGAVEPKWQHARALIAWIALITDSTESTESTDSTDSPENTESTVKTASTKSRYHGQHGKHG